MTEEAAPIPAGRRSRNRLGVVALALALGAAVVPLVVGIAVAVAAAVAHAGDADRIVYEGVLGGLVLAFGVVALLSPVSVVAVVLGAISLRRPGGAAPGIVAIVLGVLGSVGLLGLPLVLGEIVPGL